MCLCVSGECTNTTIYGGGDDDGADSDGDGDGDGDGVAINSIHARPHTHSHFRFPSTAAISDTSNLDSTFTVSEGARV